MNVVFVFSLQLKKYVAYKKALLVLRSVPQVVRGVYSTMTSHTLVIKPKIKMGPPGGAIKPTCTAINMTTSIVLH